MEDSGLVLVGWWIAAHIELPERPRATAGEEFEVFEHDLRPQHGPRFLGGLPIKISAFPKPLSKELVEAAMLQLKRVAIVVGRSAAFVALSSFWWHLCSLRSDEAEKGLVLLV